MVLSQKSQPLDEKHVSRFMRSPGKHAKSVSVARRLCFSTSLEFKEQTEPGNGGDKALTEVKNTKKNGTGCVVDSKGAVDLMAFSDGQVDLYLII